MDHRQVPDNMRVRLATRRKEVFRHEKLETNEFTLSRRYCLTLRFYGEDIQNSMQVIKIDS